MVKLVERDAQIDQIASRLDAAASGHGGTALLIGPAGLGKTALIRASTVMATERTFTVLAATGEQLGTRSPFGVVRNLFDRALMALDASQMDAIASGPAQLAVAHVLGRGAEPVEYGDLQASLSWLVDALAESGPLMLAVDDVQWADDESVLFLSSLRHRLVELPVMVLAAVREASPEQRTPALAGLVADRDALVLRLAPLSPAGVGDLVRDVWGDVDGDVTDAAAEVTGGNPFLLLAVTRLLAGTQRVTVQAVRDTVPSSVIDSVVDRLAGLDRAESSIAKAVAVLESTTTAVATELMGLDLDTAARAADNLRAVGLFEQQPGLTYRHALLRNAVYAATGADTREQLHRAAARLLAPRDVHSAAAHLLESGGTGDPWAVDLLLSAAESAMSEGAPHSAVALLRRAAAEPPAAADAAGVLLQLGLAEMRTLDERCVVTLGEAEPMLVDDGDRARCALALAEAYSYAGLHEPAADVLERTLEVVADPDLSLELEAALIATGLLVPARVASARMRLDARPGLLGESRAERLFLNQQLTNAVGTNQPAAVIRDLARRALHPSDSPERTEWVWARLFLAAIGDYDEVRNLTDDGFARAAAKGSVVGFVTASFVRGTAEFEAGALPVAEQHFRAMLEVGEANSPGDLVSLLGRSGLSQTLALEGNVSQALDLLAVFPEDSPPNAPVNGIAALLYARAVARHAAGHHEGALAAAQSLGALLADLDVDSPTWASWRPVAIGPLRALGRLDEARALAHENFSLCERAQVPDLLGEALRLVGETAEDHAEGVSALERSVDVLAGSEGRLAEGLARLSLGSALRRAGQRSRAREELLAGRALVAVCGAAPWIEYAEAELAAAGSRTTRLELTGTGALTASERRIADLAAQGLTNTEIGRMLFVSHKTVETHLSRVYRKLSIAGRGELVAALAGDGPG